MAPKGACRSEFAQLMADHILGDVYRDKPLPVMDGNRVANQFRKDDGTAGPSSDDPLLRPAIHDRHPLQQLAIDTGSFLQRTSHPILLKSSPPGYLRRFRMYLSDGRLDRVLAPLVGQPQGLTG